MPFGFPLLQGVEVGLEEFAVVTGLNGSIEETVISKESSGRISGG